MLEFLLIGELLASPWEAVEVVAVAVFFANLLTCVLPNESSNIYVQFVLDALNKLSFNILRNANSLYPNRFQMPGDYGEEKPKKKKRSTGRSVGGSDA